MAELLSTELLETLRNEADTSARPKQRNATLDRLVEACDEILSGKALQTMLRGFPEAAIFFRRSPVKLIPIRVEQYVEARFAIDIAAKRKSQWTGPRDLTIRKDARLYEYVQLRAQEQSATTPAKVSSNTSSALERIDDAGLRAELRLRLGRAERTEQDFRRLKEGMRRLRPTVDVDALISGVLSTASPDSHNHTVSAAEQRTDAVATAAVMKLQDTRFLSKFGLEFNTQFGNVVDLKTRAELLSTDELRAIARLIGLRTDEKPPLEG